jgi:hypothetical protein
VFKLQERTLPPGAKILNLTGPTEDEWGQKARWELETEMTWQTYKTWVSRELLREGFRADSVQESGLILRKPLPGDALTLNVEKLSNSPRLHVRVTFTALPD